MDNRDNIPVHYDSTKNGSIICGLDGPDLIVNSLTFNITCPKCLKKMKKLKIPEDSKENPFRNYK